MRCEGGVEDGRSALQRLRGEAILSNHRHVPLDECAHVYKDLDEVLDVFEAEGIAKVANRPYPVANIKGAD